MKIKKPEILAVVSIAAFIFGYTLYKGINSSFTHDESFTFSNYVVLPFYNIILYRHCPPIPNNHILNTLLMKASVFLFGVHEWSLRLPNLIAHLLFILYSITWLKKFNDRVLLLTGFIALNVNCYLLDFFSLARGYGLSASLIFISFYYFWLYASGLKPKHLWLAFIIAALAAWSNFTSLNYYASLTAVFFIFQFVRNINGPGSWAGKIKSFIFQCFPAIVVTLSLILLIANPLKIIENNLFGSTDGFYFNTIRSVVFYSILYDQFNTVTIVSMFVMLVLLISGCCFLYDLIKNRFNVSQSPYLLLLFITIFSGLSTVVQFYLFKTPLLENRTGLFFIMLFNICYVLLYYFLLCRVQKKAIVHVIFSAYALFLLIIFANSYRPGYYFDWKYDCSTKEMLNLLEHENAHLSSGNGTISLGIPWYYEPTIKFYRDVKKLNWLNPVDREGYEKDFDYYYVHNDESFVLNRKLEIVKKFETAESILARRP